MVETECVFCRDYKQQKYYDKKYFSGSSLTNKYSICLVSETFAGEIHKGTSRYYGYALNYCPNCGARMEDVE